MSNDPFGALTDIDLMEGSTSFYSLATLETSGITDLDRLPFSIRILLENALRHSGGRYVGEDHVRAIADWSPTNAGADVPFMPFARRSPRLHGRSRSCRPGRNAGWTQSAGR